jgi:hypothetical protein
MTNIRTHLIKEIDQNISKQKISKNEIGQLLRDIRCLIEFDNQTENYKTLYFYCNWAAHPNIDRNKGLYPLLDKINIGFAELNGVIEKKKFPNYIDVIIDAIDFNDLTENFHRLLLHIYPLKKFKDLKLIIPICENLIQKKIHYPENLVKKDVKKDLTVLKITQISEQIDKIEKHLNPALDSNFDYSKPVFIKSFMITDVKDNKVFVELEIDIEKDVKLISSIEIN